MTKGMTGLRKSAILLTGGAILLMGCDTSPGSLTDRLDRRPNTNNAVVESAPRPKPDSRGLITYPHYQVIVANRGDTMNDVASRIGMTGVELARYNGLDPNYMPRSGEVLALPKGVVIPVGSTSVAAGTSAGTAAGTNNIEAIASTAIGRAGNQQTAAVQQGPEPIRHVVEQGETAYSIARLYRVSVTSLASWNGLGKDLAVRTGQRLLIPVVEDGTPARQTQQVAAVEPAPGQGSITPIPPSAVEPLPEPVEEAVVPDSPNLAAERTPAGASRKLLKPVSGEVLRGYSNKPGGNEGLDIAADKGTTVKAAENGEVALVSSAGGNSKIVLVRHPDNLYTVYSNLSDVSVSKGQNVSRGQSLGKVAGGSPGFVHFEIRRGTESVDPTPYL
ncbi:peptidoglycan DD-metalloendopeptidase family protein [Neptunicoccus sediminis]|uniref:peptidoglycan DD-metalloendopeptidase family protein n=1 Tax=Neptunicoccus sediminis TaxID=1892596 RepID=UPI0009F16E08|nr:peptidoglycan DD-metalloendopeptidase family protein [Neptunicoccus sediminis]